MTQTKTQPWDVADYLETDKAQLAYLAAVLEGVVEEGDPDFVAVALVDIARARGLSEALARELRLQIEGEEDGTRSPRLLPLPSGLSALDILQQIPRDTVVA